MASKRCIPTSLFASPDFFELSSDTVRLIFLGLILDADDEGRGSAHPRLLARKLDKTPQEIEQALAELQTHESVCCYMVRGRRYYVLTHWQKYQVLSHPTPSSYPSSADADTEQGKESRGNPQRKAAISSETRKAAENRRLEEEGEEEENRTESESERESEDEGEAPSRAAAVSLPAGITRFPTAHSNASDEVPTLTKKNLEILTQQVASRLKLAVSADLQTIVEEFAQTPGIALVGEAIEARAWIDDPRRNRQQPLTLAFFRRWLKRQRGDYGAPPQASGRPLRPTETQRTTRTEAASSVENISVEENPYHAHIQRRLAEVQAQYEQRRAEAEARDAHAWGEAATPDAREAVAG